MTPSHVRAELLGEHFELRRLLEEARATIDAESTPSGALRDRLNQLADALLSHATHEELALKLIFSETSARHAVMDEQHVAEHAHLVDVVRECASLDVPAGRARIAAVLRRLESHMTEEEEVLLGEELFADEVETD